MTEKISNKIRTFVIEYPDDNPNCATEHHVPLNSITGLSKLGQKYTLSAVDWGKTEISKETFEELEKYFEPVVIESRE